MSDLMKFMMVVIAFAFLLFLNSGLSTERAVQSKERGGHFTPKRIAA
jgi:hypothetical protein